MSEVPQLNNSTEMYEPGPSGMNFHASPEHKITVAETKYNGELSNDSLKGIKEEDATLDPCESDTSGIYFSSTRNRSSNYFADEEYSSDEQNHLDGNIGENSSFKKLGSSFHRSPYLLRSSLCQSSSSFSSTSYSENEIERENCYKESHNKRRPRKTLTQYECQQCFPKVALKSTNIQNEKSCPIIKKPNVNYLPAVKESEEEYICHSEIMKNLSVENYSFEEKNNTSIESHVTLKNDSNTDPHILNINVHIPREFREKEIPLNVNFISQPVSKNNSYNENYCEENDQLIKSIFSPRSTSSELEDRNSILINELIKQDQTEKIILEKSESAVQVKPCGGKPEMNSNFENTNVQSISSVEFPIQSEDPGNQHHNIASDSNTSKGSALSEHCIEITLPIDKVYHEAEKNSSITLPGPSTTVPVSQAKIKKNINKETTKSKKALSVKKGKQNKVGKKNNENQESNNKKKAQHSKSNRKVKTKTDDKQKVSKRRNVKPQEKNRPAKYRASRNKCNFRVKFICKNHRKNHSSSDSDSSCCSVCKGTICDYSLSSESSDVGCECCESSMSDYAQSSYDSSDSFY